MSKKLLALLLALVCALSMLSMTACGQEEDVATEETETTETTEDTVAGSEAVPMSINSEPFTVAATDCDEDGFFLLKCDATSDYKVTYYAPEDVSWKLYITDEPFQDSNKTVAETGEPTIELKASGESVLNIKEGQYIYCYTNHNKSELGSDATISSDVYLEFFYAE